MLFQLFDKHNGTIHTSIFFVCTALFVYLLFSYYAPLEILALFVGSTILTGFTTSGFLHRYCSHRSWSMPKWLEVFLLSCTTLMMNSPAMGWAALHISHHRYTDKPGDPHGWVKSIWENFCVFSQYPSIKHIPRWMLRSKLYAFQAKWYWESALVLQALFVYAFGWQLLVSLIAISYLYQVGLNLVGHTPELKPRNNAFLSVFWGGELYHANHHWKPNDPRFGTIDFTYYFMIKWAEMLASSKKNQEIQ
jgi:fatty-acid desaturase